MNNKKHLIFTIAGFVFIFMLLRFWSHFNILKELYDESGKEYIKLCFKNFHGSNNSLEFMDEFWIKDEDFSSKFKFEDNKTYTRKIYDSNLYDKNLNQQVIKIIEDNLPRNYKNYRTKLVPSFMNLIKQKQTKYVFDEKSLDELSEPVRYNYLRDSAMGILYISLKLVRDRDFRNALILSHGLLHLGNILLTKNIKTGTFINDLMSYKIRSYGSYGILHWASSPKPGYEELSLSTAKNILNLVENEASCSQRMKACYKCLARIFDCISDNNWFVWASSDSSLSKEYTEIQYDRPMKYIDKPYYEIKDLLNQNDKDFKKLFEDEKYNNPYYFFFMPSSYITKTFWIKLSENYDLSQKKAINEENLALMEMSAIALVFNAYVSKTGKMPNSIEALEKWFGNKLPINRLTGKPYVFFEEKGCILYNLGRDGKKDKEKDYSKNDMYFKFSE